MPSKIHLFQDHEFGRMLCFEGGMLTLDQLIASVSGACDRFLAENGAVGAMYHAIARDGTHYVFDAPPFPKPVAIALVKNLFAMLDIVAYAFCDEAWMVEKPAALKELKVPPRADPARIEIITVIGEAEAEPSKSILRKIKREAGKRAWLEPPELELEELCGGQMVGLLPKKGRLQ